MRSRFVSPHAKNGCTVGLGREAPEELATEPALPDSRFAFDQNRSGGARPDTAPYRLQFGQRVAPAGQVGSEECGGAGSAASRGAHRIALERRAELKKCRCRLGVRGPEPRVKRGIQSQGLHGMAVQVGQVDEMPVTFFLERQLFHPPLSQGKAFPPVAVRSSSFDQTAEADPQATVLTLALRLEPESKIFSSHVVRACQELAAPAFHRLLPSPRGNVVLEAYHIERESSRGQEHPVRIRHEPITDDPLQLEQNLAERLPRPCCIPLPPEQIGKLTAADRSW